MGRSCFLKLLLVSFFLCLFFSQGSSLRPLKTVQHEDSSFEVKETSGKPRELIEVMDYLEPEPNTNPRGYVFSPPPKRY